MKRLLIVLLALCCTSCAALPAEERAFAVALCATRQDDLWQVYARVPAYKTGGEYLTVAGEGVTIDAALADLNASAPMQTSLSQLRLLVLSDRLAGEDVSALWVALSARHDLRMQCGVAVMDAPVQAVADALKPTTGARLSKAIDVLMESRTEQGCIPRAALADVLRMGDRQSLLLMRLTLSEGEIGLSGAYPVDGTGRILPPLDGEETALLSMLRGDAKELRLILTGGHAHVRDVQAKITMDEELGTARVKLTMQAVAASLPQEALAQTIADGCVRLLSRLAAEGCDVLGLGRHAALCGGKTDERPDWLRSIRWEVTVLAELPA